MLLLSLNITALSPTRNYQVLLDDGSQVQTTGEGRRLLPPVLFLQHPGFVCFHSVLLGCCLFIECAWQDSVIDDVNYLGLGLACADVCQTLDQVIGLPRTVGRFRWKSRGVTATPRVHLKARARAGG